MSEMGGTSSAGPDPAGAPPAAQPLRRIDRFSARKRRPKPWLVALLVVLHIGALYALMRAMVPDAVQSVESSIVSTFNVTVTAPEPEPEPEPEPDQGAAGEAGAKAVPKPVTAPSPKVTLKPDPPMPKASSTGTAVRSGARDEGEGTGAAGEGAGTGSGRAGSGQGGGGAVTKPSVKSGRIDAARDFPIPDEGRQIREGTSVTVIFTVGTDGRASGCRVAKRGPDAATNALVCPLVMERIRFNPARDANGNPVPAQYGWRQDFCRGSC
jgi:protein TonB